MGFNMAYFKANSIHKPKNASIKVGWIDTLEHPGYEGRKATGATIAEVARYNLKYRDYATKFYQDYIRNPELKIILKKEMSEAVRVGKFNARLLEDYLHMGLIETIVLTQWPGNTEAWLKFKAAHGLSLDPLRASQVMLDSIETQVTYA